MTYKLLAYNLRRLYLLIMPKRQTTNAVRSPQVRDTFPVSEEAPLTPLKTNTPSRRQYAKHAVEGEFIGLRPAAQGGPYVLLVNGQHARITSFHDENGNEVYTLDNADLACALVNGLVQAFPMTLVKTVH
jgi:hypothetical protein